MLKCMIYFAVTGLLSFFLGRLIPPNKMEWHRFPYKHYAAEREGAVYKKIGIHHWQNKVPDMSKIFPKLMPPKKMVDTDKESLLRMIQETCTAELIHMILCLTGLYCIRLWPGAGGIVLAVLNIVLFNLPFILIQRYNRPRLVRLYKRQIEKELQKEYGNTDPDL